MMVSDRERERERESLDSFDQFDGQRVPSALWFLIGKISRVIADEFVEMTVSYGTYAPVPEEEEEGACYLVHFVGVAREEKILSSYMPNKKLRRMLPDFKKQLSEWLIGNSSNKAAADILAVLLGQNLQIYRRVVEGWTFFCVTTAGGSQSLVLQYLGAIANVFRARFGPPRRPKISRWPNYSKSR
jgi:hypothetical protein